MSGMWNQVEKLDGKGNFSVWQCVVIDVLVQQGLIDVLKGIKPESTTAEEWKVMERKAISTIRLCLFDELISVDENIEENDKVEQKKSRITGTRKARARVAVHAIFVTKRVT
uniref:Retrotransposon Copia-like N-terminal domain-containing protein n=1 Tax=Setaria viridis TaxID=4556 RepID=A0A4U6T2N0_SETVI|nr:hypothetical protein SEVIR_9G352900v2 [Setaria viridis]